MGYYNCGKKMEYVRIMFMARLSMEGIALGSVAKLYYVGGGGVGYWLNLNTR